MRVLPCPLEVPPTRARRLGGAEEKNAGGGRTIGVWTRLFRGGGGAPLHTCFGKYLLTYLFRGGGRKNTNRNTPPHPQKLDEIVFGVFERLLECFNAL